MKDSIRIPARGEDAELVAQVTDGDDGSIAPVLYLHGFGSSQDGEKAVFFRDRAERAGMRFVSLDFQGHGRSGGSMRGLSLSRCLRDVERVREHVPRLDGSISMFGSSMGALVALWHAAGASAADGARSVRSMALISPALGLEATLAETLGAEGMARWQREGVLEVTNELGTFELGWDFVADLQAFSTSGLTARHTTPSLIFQGKLDDRVPWREVAAFAQAHPEVTRLELLADGDHRLVDRLDWIWTEARNFLRDATPALPAT